MTVAALQGADDRLTRLVRALREAPDIVRYADVFPRLEEKHLRFLVDVSRTPRAEAAALLTASGRREPPDLAVAIQDYRDRGELPALRTVADIDSIARTAMEWQRKIDELVRRAEALAALCDAEAVPGADDLTWAKQFNRVRTLVSGDYADSPASQDALLQKCLAEMEQALERFRQSLQERLARAVAELDQKRAVLNHRARFVD